MALPGLAPQTPAVQTSSPLQRLPSEHDVPSGSSGVLHRPVVLSHAPAMWHASAAAQITFLHGSFFVPQLHPGAPTTSAQAKRAAILRRRTATVSIGPPPAETLQR